MVIITLEYALADIFYAVYIPNKYRVLYQQNHCIHVD